MAERGQAIDLSKYHSALEEIPNVIINGKVSKVVGLVIEGQGPRASIGAQCDIFPKDGQSPVRAEVVGFKGNKVLLMPLGDPKGISPVSTIVAVKDQATAPVGLGLLGRVIDGTGRPIDDRGPLEAKTEYPLYADPINPLQRRPIREPMDVGIRAINSLLTCGKGQRLGIFSGSGVGKSVLLGMMARNTAADVSVICLIGERGREVGEFIQKDLGEEGLKRSIVVAATSDQPPLIRMRGAYLATAIAEYFRDVGKDVLLMMDSITRFAFAQRQIGLAIGEPPATKGYTPSVFTLMPKLLERAGSFKDKGSITGLYTVLVESDDLNEPISDTVRSILDGHIALSRNLANQNHYPPIDLLSSVSRVMVDVVSKEQKEQADQLIEILSTYRRSEDLINIGAYVSGSNPKIDRAIQMIDRINGFLKQGIEERVDLTTSIKGLKKLLGPH